jgi:hypothetical protein
MDGFLAEENLIYVGLAAFYALIIGYLVIRWSRNRDKYLIRIKYPTEQKLLIKPDGKIIVVEKAKGRRLGWKFNFDVGCLFFTKGWFTKRLTLDVMPDAKAAIPYGRLQTPEDLKNIAIWDRKTHEEVATLEGLRALAHLVEQKPSLLLYIVILLQIISLILPFLEGRLRF